MNTIVLVDSQWAIGNEGDQLAYIPEDLKRFRALTDGKVVIMGRKTLATLPRGQPLKNRINIILTSDKKLAAQGALLCHSVPEVMEAVQAYPQEDIFVIGGASVYEQLLPFCDTAFVTKFSTENTYKADRYFPNLDRLPEWSMVEQAPEQHHEETRYRFCVYRRREVKESREIHKAAVRHRGEIAIGHNDMVNQLYVDKF